MGIENTKNIEEQTLWSEVTDPSLQFGMEQLEGRENVASPKTAFEHVPRGFDLKPGFEGPNFGLPNRPFGVKS